MKTATRIVMFLLIVWLAGALAFETTFGTALDVQVGPITIHLFDILFAAGVALLVWQAFSVSGTPVPASNRAVLACVLAYCAYQIAIVLPVAVVFHGLDPVAVLRQLETRLSLLLIPFTYLVGLRYVKPRQVIMWINAAAVFLAGYAVYKYLTAGIQGAQGDATVFRVRELWGGATLLFGFLILTALFLRRPGVIGVVLAIVGLVGVGLTNHRSGYVALIVTVPPLLINSRRVLLRTVMVVAVLLVAAGLVLAASPTLRQSVVYSLQTLDNPTADRSARDRVDRSELGWEYFLAHPLGDYQWNQEYYLVYVGPDNFEPHNFVIQLLGQEGIVAFALFISVIALTARLGWRNRRRDRMSAVMLAYLAFYLIFCLFNTNLLNLENVFLLVFPIALILDCNAGLQESLAEARDGLDVGSDGVHLPPAAA